MDPFNWTTLYSETMVSSGICVVNVVTFRVQILGGFSGHWRRETRLTLRSWVTLRRRKLARGIKQLATVHALTVRENVYLRNRIGFDLSRNESNARDTADSSFLGENQYQPVWYSYSIFRIWSFNFAIWNSICELQCHRVGNRRSWPDSKLEIQDSLSTIQNINGQP